jgi:hypothetical protein
MFTVNDENLMIGFTLAVTELFNSAGGVQFVAFLSIFV